jgi:hypothetical protein
MTTTRIEIELLPQSADEFVALRDQLAHRPEGGAAMMVVALLLYTEDETLGRACLAVAAESSRLQEGPNGYRGWQLCSTDLNLIRSQLGQRPYIARSYLDGATPENGYALPEGPCSIYVSRHAHSGAEESGRCSVFVACSGADSPRPVILARNDRGIWKAAEWSSLLVGVRPPASQTRDEL